MLALFQLFELVLLCGLLGLSEALTSYPLSCQSKSIDTEASPIENMAGVSALLRIVRLMSNSVYCCFCAGNTARTRACCAICRQQGLDCILRPHCLPIPFACIHLRILARHRASERKATLVWPPRGFTLYLATCAEAQGF